MMINRGSIKQLLGSLLLLSLSMESSAFDTLFTSPQQRESLDQHRSQGTAFLSAPKPRLRSTSTPKPKKIFFNGYVIRNSGPNTAWANDKEISNNNSQISAKLNQIKGTLVPIKPSAASKTIRLQPGQSLNLETGKIAESYSQKKPIPPAHNSKKVAFSIDHQSTEPKQRTKEQVEKSGNDIPEQE